MDDIVREARIGSNYHCLVLNNDNDSSPIDCTNGATSFAMTEVTTGNLVRYSIASVNSKTVLMKEVIAPNGTPYSGEFPDFSA
jgi:hypothetical protein